MTDNPIRTLGDFGERIRGEGQEFVDSLLMEAETAVLHGPVVVLWFTPSSQLVYHVEGPYTFAEATEAVQVGLAEQLRDLPDEPPPTVEMHVLWHRIDNP